MLQVLGLAYYEQKLISDSDMVLPSVETVTLNTLELPSDNSMRRMLPNVQSLILKSYSTVNISKNFPLLNELKICCTSRSARANSTITTCDILRGLSNLKELVLLNIPGVVNFTSLPKKLEKITVVGSKVDFSKNIASSCPHLQQLHVLDAPSCSSQHLPSKCIVKWTPGSRHSRSKLFNN